MSDLVQVSSENGAALITLNRPEHRNALTLAMVEELDRAIAAATRDPAAHIVVLRSSSREFCAGLDLDEFYRSASAGSAEHEREARLLSSLLGSLLGARRPLVSLVQGRAMGIGATLAVAADVVIASDAAVFGFPEVTFGFVPAFAAAIVPGLTGARTAFELLATGRLVKGEEARRIGIASRVVPEEGFDAVTRSMVKHLSETPVEIMEAVKDAFRVMQGQTVERRLELSAAINARARASQAFKEAARQFFSMA